MQEFAAAIETAFVANLEAHLSGRNLPEQRHLPLGPMILRGQATSARCWVSGDLLSLRA